MAADLLTLLQTQAPRFRPVIAPTIPAASYVPIDLSSPATDLAALDLTDATAMEVYITNHCRQQQGLVAYGGYLEQRNLYQRSAHFEQDGAAARNIHLGVDFWAAAGTPVVAPLAGRVHSFQDNMGLGNYGPTILLEHQLQGLRFYTLYGHLSRASLNGLVKRQPIAAGEVLATLGEAAVNGDYAPHLHVQLIQNLDGQSGDYPGVCTLQDLDFYQQNCPDPLLLVGL